MNLKKSEINLFTGIKHTQFYSNTTNPLKKENIHILEKYKVMEKTELERTFYRIQLR